MSSLLDILLVTGFIQGSIVGIILVFHRAFKNPMYSLLGWATLLMSLECLSQNELLSISNTWIYWLNNGNLFVLGPLFYFFVRAVKTDAMPSRRLLLLHLTPFLIIKLGTVILGPTNLGEEIFSPSFFVVLNQFLVIHGITYAVLAFLACFKGEKGSDNDLEKWTFRLALVYAFGWISSFVGRQLEWYSASSADALWAVAYFALITMIFVTSIKLMLYKANIYVASDEIGDTEKPTHIRHSKYQRSVLDVEECQRLTALLERVVVEEKLYLDPELNRARLAGYIDVSPHTLSQLLNTHIQKSFSEYINEFRLVEAKRKLIDPAYNNYTILSIAYESGFQSKSSFQRLFKKYTGKTPSQFISEIKS